MHRQDFSYYLPEELIAQSPLAERSASRLLVLDGATGGIADRLMGDLPGYLRAGDLLVFNDTRVVAARVIGSKPSGGRVEIFLERAGVLGPGESSGGRGVPARGASHAGGGGCVSGLAGAGDEAGANGEGAAGGSASGEDPSAETASGEDDSGQDVSGEGAGVDRASGKGASGNGASGEGAGDDCAGSAEDSGKGVKPGAAEPTQVRQLGHREALVQLRASKPIREGLEIATAGGVVRVVGREDELWRVETPEEALEFFEKWGEVPLPPYIHRTANAGDRERYQSIFAREKGAVAAPTASLHFDAGLVAKLDAMAVGRAFVTLHVGAGTFQPLRTDDLDAHKMHAERVSVSRATWDAIRRTRAAGGRVVAVGTTVVRALESAALEVASGAATTGMTSDTGAPGVATAGRALERGALSVATTGRALEMVKCAESTRSDVVGSAGSPGDFAMSDSEAIASGAGTGPSTADRERRREPRDGVRAAEVSAAAVSPAEVSAAAVSAETAWSGETRLFIRPGFKFQVVDAMVTNFHLPESTLLMLVSAFAGRENVLAAYAHAVRERYRFFSYGDAMFVMPAKPTAQLAATSANGVASP